MLEILLFPFDNIPIPISGQSGCDNKRSGSKLVPSLHSLCLASHRRRMSTGVMQPWLLSLVTAN